MISKVKMMMKKIPVIFSALVLSAVVSGQQSFDCLLKAKALIGSGASDQAVGVITTALDGNKDYRLMLERADAYLAGGRFGEAVSDLNEANSLAAGSGEYGLACAYAMKGDASTALYHLEISMKSSFRRSEKEIMLNPVFDKIGNTPEWRSFWKKDWYSDLDEAVSEIEFYTSAGKVQEAKAAYSEISSKYSGDKNTGYAGALISIAEARYPDAVKALTSLLTSDPDNQRYLYALARAQFLSSNYAGASGAYSKLIGLEIPDAGLLISRAQCYMKTGEIDKARADIGKFLSIYPGDKIALQQAGRIEISSGDNLKALSYFSENLRLHPHDPGCYIDRANAYLMSRSWDYAVQDYGMSLDLDPENADAWLNKGIALANSGRTDDACHDFRTSLSLGNKKATDYISRYCFK